MTAEILSKKTGLDIVFRHELREIHLGEWEGLTTDEIIEKYGLSLYSHWKENPSAQIGLGVENMLSLQERAWREFEAIAGCEAKDFIIVAHGTWIRCLMCKLLNIPLTGRASFELDNAGINVVGWDKGGDIPSYTVITLNDVSHFALETPTPAI